MATAKVTVDGESCGGPAVSVALGGVLEMKTSASLRARVAPHAHADKYCNNIINPLAMMRAYG